MDNKKRCKWCNMKNSLYIKYHDEEWCKPNFDEKYLYEMLILESFQAGLSWECVLNKRQAFEMAYDNFNIEKVCQYDDEKIIELQQNKEIIRNKLKIKRINACIRAEFFVPLHCQIERVKAAALRLNIARINSRNCAH